MIRGISFPAIGKDERQREQQTTGRGTFVPLVFQPGEAFQFDWSEDWAIVDGERTKLQVAHIKLSHSRAFLLRAYPLQTHEMLFDAHWHAFRVFAGVPGRGIYDSEAWPPWVRGQAERALPSIAWAAARNGRSTPGFLPRFLAMTSHYVFEPEFSNPAAGWGEPLCAIGSRTMASGQVEKNVQGARHRLWQPMPNFPDLAALNVWLERRCQELWGEIPHGVLPGSVAEVWAEEKAALMPLPPAFDGFVEHEPSASRRPA